MKRSGERKLNGEKVSDKRTNQVLKCVSNSFEFKSFQVAQAVAVAVAVAVAEQSEIQLLTILLQQIL